MAATLAALCFFAIATLVHALDNGDVRLVNGPSSNKGRVEVYYDGQWGTICDDSWNQRDAKVVCKQLGFEDVNYVRFRGYYGEGTGPIWIDQINCENNDQSILDCRHNGWGIHDCKHREDAGVECRRKTAVKPPSLPVRLSCPSYSNCGSCNVCPEKKFPDPDDCLPQNAAEGIVEVFYNDVWRPVSDDGWDLNSANVVCGELGYPLAMAIPSVEELWCNWNQSECEGSGSLLELEKECLANDVYRNEMRTTLIKTLECSGKEYRLLDCYFSEFGPTVSSSMKVATARCGYIPHPNCNINNKNVEMYRTRGSAVPWAGRVEVRIGGEWGTVCDRQWDQLDAGIVCRALGYGSAKSLGYRSSYGRGAGKIHFSHLKCDGSERLLSRCEARTGRDAQSCGHGADAGVVCNIPDRSTCNKESPSSRISKQPETNGFLSDFAEVHDNSGWGLLCFEAVDMNSARVICRESSQNYAFRIRKGTHPDFTRRRYTLSLQCTGDEESIKDCRKNLIPVMKCNSPGEAIIDCSGNLPDLVPDLEPFTRSLQYYPYLDRSPLYYLSCAHEEKCLSSSANGVATADRFQHTRTLLRFSSQTMNYGTADFTPILSRSEWIWHSCHNHYHSFEAFIHYDLINVQTGVKAAEGHKASFCLEDTYCEAGGAPRYRCSLGIQGISMNCGDLYGRHLDCQWIDITDVPDGTYILRQSVNPDKLTPETDYRNNVEECTVKISKASYYGSLTVDTASCHLSDH